MKKFHICFYISLFFISACSDFKGNEDDVEASLSSTTVGNECVIGAVYGHSKAITQFRVPGIGVTFATNGNHITGITTFSSHVQIPDAVASNEYASLYLGDGNDIRLFHNGQHSFLQHKLVTPANGGNFYIDSYATTYMRTSDGSSGVENAIVMNSNSSVDVYHSGTKKLETSSTGIKLSSGVSGSVSNILQLDHNGNNNGDGPKITFSRAGTIRSEIESLKNETSNNETDIIFRTTAAGSLGEKLRIAASGQIRIDQATSANNGIRMRPSGWNYDFRFLLYKKKSFE